MGFAFYHRKAAQTSSRLGRNVPFDLQLKQKFADMDKILSAFGIGGDSRQANEKSALLDKNQKETVELVIFLRDRAGIYFHLEDGNIARADELLELVIEEQGLPQEAKEVFSMWFVSSVLDVRLKAHHQPFQIIQQWDHLCALYTDAKNDEIRDSEPVLMVQRDVFYPKEQVKLYSPSCCILLYIWKCYEQIMHDIVVLLRTKWANVKLFHQNIKMKLVLLLYHHTLSVVICVCVCVCVCVCMCVCDTYKHTYTNTHLHTNAHTCTHPHTHTPSSNIQILLLIQREKDSQILHLCIMLTHTQSHTNTSMHASAHTNTDMYAHIHTHTHTHTHVHTHTRTHTPYVCTCTCNDRHLQTKSVL